MNEQAWSINELLHGQEENFYLRDQCGKSQVGKKGSSCPLDILKMSRNKSFDVRARFGAIYSASKTKKYLLKNSTIGNQLLFSFLANTEFTCPENSNWWLLLPDSNLFLKFQNNFTAEFWATFSYWLLLQRFFWNFFGTFIMSMKADTKNFNKKYQQNFLLDAIFFEHQGPFKR